MKAEEIKLLQVFRSSIEADARRLNWDIKDFDSRNDNINIILRHLEEDLPHHDSIDIYFMNSTAVWMPRLDQEVFATLTSTDLNIISNDTLEKKRSSHIIHLQKEDLTFLLIGMPISLKMPVRRIEKT